MNARSSIRLTAALGAAAVFCLAPTAMAAPDRTQVFNAATTAFEWDGGPVTGLPVIDIETDDTLFKLETPGTLTVETTQPDDTAVDIDIFVYKADAAGDPAGDSIASAETGSAEEKVTVADLEPGDYAVRVSGFLAISGMFKGKASFEPKAGAPAAPGTTPPAGGTAGAGASATDLPPDAKIGTFAKASKAGKLRSFSGTAKDDKGVSRVELAVVQIKGSKCSQMNAKGAFTAISKCSDPTRFLRAKGTTKWSFKLPKALKKGSYQVFARAIDSKGQVQAGFKPASRKSFKVR